MHALVGVDLLLHRDLVVGAGLEAAADARRTRPSVFSRKTTKLTSASRPILERAQPIVEQPDRAVVHVEVELEPGAEQDVARVPIVGHARIAERADEDGVELVAQHAVAVGGQRLAGRQVVIGAPGKRLEVERVTAARATASSTLTASAVTSLPMPSPGMTAMRSNQPILSNDRSNGCG